MFHKDEIVCVETFRSISGEVSRWPQGHTCGFVRFANCNLDCSYCDTTYKNCTEQYLKDVENWALGTQNKDGMICITGGEPLLNRHAVSRLLFVLDKDKVSIETNGTIDFSVYIGHTNLVVDYKLHYMYDRIPNEYYHLTKNDFIKFVVGSVIDMQKAMNIQKRIQKENKEVNFAYSVLIPDDEKLSLIHPAKRIYVALRNEGLAASINIQIHKLLNFL